jgi:hypothetical protein
MNKLSHSKLQMKSSNKPVNSLKKNLLPKIAFLLFCTFILQGAGVFLFPCQAQDAPPNFIIILADDMGIGDVNYDTSSENTTTPELAKMAQEGKRLTSFRTTSPSCSPSRASLLTGRHHRHIGIDEAIGKEVDKGLFGSEKTIAEALRDLGYSTGMVGKWHLGFMEDGYLPYNQGFDYFYGSKSSGMGARDGACVTDFKRNDNGDIIAEIYVKGPGVIGRLTSENQLTDDRFYIDSEDYEYQGYFGYKNHVCSNASYDESWEDFLGNISSATGDPIDTAADVFTEKAITWMNGQTGPFFLY